MVRGGVGEGGAVVEGGGVGEGGGVVVCRETTGLLWREENTLELICSELI